MADSCRAAKLQKLKFTKRIRELESQLKRKECDQEQHLRAQFIDQIRRLEQTVDAKKDAVGRLRSKLSCSPLVKEVAELKRERAVAVEEASTLRAQLGKAHSQIDTLQREVDLLNKDLS